MSPRTFVLLAALVAVVVSGSGAARAQSSPKPPAAGADQASAVERARLLHEEGLRYYGAGQYGRAVAAYRKAYALVPAPGILFNLAQAYRLRGDCRRAYRAYRNFLDAVTTDSPEAKLAREHAQALRPCAKAGTDKPEDAALATTAAPVPPPAPAPGPQVTSDVPASPAPTAAEPPAGAVELGAPRDVSPGQNKKLVGIGIGAAGAALAVVGVYYGFKARGEASDLSEFFDEGGAWTPELADSEDSLDRDRALGLGFGLVGAAAIGTGVVLYWLGHQESSLERADQGPVSLVPRADGALVTWLGSF